MIGVEEARVIEEMARRALAEDIGDGDRTTEWTIPEGTRGTAAIVARAQGVIAGTDFADAVFAVADSSLGREWVAGDGTRVKPEDVVVRLDGSLASILKAERTALNGLGRLSGIATATAIYVAALEGTAATLIDTRKTTPGWRRLEKAATRVGGARNHRMGLFDMVLIKENHIRGAGGVIEALEAVRGPAEREGLQVEIEVSTLAELDLVLSSRPPDRILLDNMSISQLRDAVARTAALPDRRPLLEASGGIDLDTLRSVAETGVDLISAGAITHSAPALDLSLLVDP